jgi:hypothetical protein
MSYITDYKIVTSNFNLKTGILFPRKGMDLPAKT